MNPSLLVLVVSLAVAEAAAEVPVQHGCSKTRVEISLDAERHNAHILWIPGKPLELRVTPAFDAWNDVQSWEVGIFHFADKGGRNLLAPTRNWHGLQPFHVLPDDVEGSGFGPRRVIKRPEFRCTIEILEEVTKPSRVMAGMRVFESLKLAVEVELKPPSSSTSGAKSKEMRR